MADEKSRVFDAIFRARHQSNRVAEKDYLYSELGLVSHISHQVVKFELNSYHISRLVPLLLPSFFVAQ